MKQEEKILLLQDLCARLPYGIKFPITVKNPITSEPIETIGTISDINRYSIVSFVWVYEDQEILVKNSLHIKDVKPYLFPISSMTEEQESYLYFNTKFKIDMFGDLVVRVTEDDNYCYTDIIDYVSLINWLNKNHFDYRGLIDKGLAIDATGKNIY